MCSALELVFMTLLLGQNGQTTTLVSRETTRCTACLRTVKPSKVLQHSLIGLAPPPAGMIRIIGSAVHTRYKRNYKFIAAAKSEVLGLCELELQAPTNLKASRRVPAGFGEDETRRLTKAYQYFKD